jgi:hypothetical protein
LKLARRIIRHETAVFENAAKNATAHLQTDLAAGDISEIDELSRS